MYINSAILGSRMHYAVPKILFKHNLLKNHYTDYHSTFLPPEKFKTLKFFQKLASRNSNISPKFVVRNNFLGLNIAAQRKFKRNTTDYARNVLSDKINKQFCEWAIGRGVCDAESVYAMKGAALEIFESCGNKVTKILEQSLVTKKTEIYNINRCLNFFGLQKLSYPAECYEKFHERNLSELRCADMILVPSRYVFRDVKSHVPEAKIFLVPYGVDMGSAALYSNRNYNDKIRTVLTVGEVGIRKGSLFVWEQAKRFPEIEFVMVGPNNLPIDLQIEMPRNVVLKGSLSKQMVKKYFSNSDLFFLPSVAEGSATVIYEAMSFGLPVICSYQSGSPVQNGFNGATFDPFNIEETSKKIEKFMDLSSRRRIRQNIESSTSDFSFDGYEERLLRLLRRFTYS